MSPLSRLSVAVVLALAFARCTQEPPPPEPDPLIVTSDLDTVKADGTASVLISVTGAKAPVRLTATQGTWLGTGKAISTLEGDGSLLLLLFLPWQVAVAALLGRYMTRPLAPAP